MVPGGMVGQSVMAADAPLAAELEGPGDVRAALGTGLAIPAQPLALHGDGSFDERHQRAVTRYQLAAGVGGLAVAVHSTEFAIREPGVDLFAPVLELVAETARSEAGRDVVMIAGACGPTSQAVAEAEVARELGYGAVLLSPGGLGDHDETQLIERTRAVAEVLPVIGFYLQAAVGGRVLSPAYWRALVEIDGVVGIKAAPFDRYGTVDVLRSVALSGRGADVTVYTGNDDAIVHDLVTPFDYPADGGTVRTWMRGGLLGQWAIWTREAVRLLERVQAYRDGEGAGLGALLRLAPQLTDANGAVFDAANGFRGCIPGIKAVLHGQGLLGSTRCLDPAERLSPGQAEEISRVRRAYPWLTDDDFVAEHLDEWLR